jgi:hypothetical protein
MTMLSTLLVLALAPQETDPATSFPETFERTSEDGRLTVRVTERIIGYNDPAMNQESFVTSTDGHRVAYMVMVGEGLAVTIDGETGERFEGIVQNSIVFSPGGEHVGYVGTRPGRQFAVLDGKAYEYEGIARPGITFSPDGAHSAWVGEREGHQLAVVDGVEGPAFEGIVPIGILFSPDSSRHAYVAISGQKQVAIVDGVVGPLFDVVSGLVFSPDSKVAAYVGVREKKWTVVAEEREIGPYDSITSMTMDPTSQEGFQGIVFPAKGSRMGFLATREERHYAVIDGQEYGPYETCTRLNFSPDGSRSAFLARDETGVLMVLDGEEHRGTAFNGLFFSPDGKRCATVVRRGNDQIVSVDGVESAPYHKIEQVLFSPDSSRVAFVATDGVERTIVLDGKPCEPLRRFGKLPISFLEGSQRAVWSERWGGGERIVVEGVEGPQSQGFRSITFSADGQRHAYASQRRPDSWTVVVDGVEYGPEGRIEGPDDPTWKLVGKQTPVFSPDGKRWACSALQRNGKFVVVTSDGWRSADYDLIMKGTVEFTPDNRHLLFIGARGEAESGQRYIVVDGLEIGNGWHGFLQDSSFQFHSPTSFCMRGARNPRNLLIELEIEER